ncbi:MAG: alpha/beta fold hydrolase [Acidimicrobiia bacterium]
MSTAAADDDSPPSVERVAEAVAHDEPVIEAPPLPPGRAIELPGRGLSFIRELSGPPDAPTVMLLHGWTASADLNWFPAYVPLSEHFHVVAIDHRGHGRGIRSRKSFKLEDCADDVVVLADVLGIDRFIAVGYSMGGPISQLLWRRHPERVAALVECATARSFAATTEERLGFLGLGSLALASRIAPAAARAWFGHNFFRKRGRTFHDWVDQEVERHDLTAILQAGHELGQFSSRDWIGLVDVPCAALITTRDHVVPERRQERLAESLPGCRAWRIDGDHDVCVAHPDVFVPALLDATRWVAGEVEKRRGDDG